MKTKIITNYYGIPIRPWNFPFLCISFAIIIFFIFPTRTFSASGIPSVSEMKIEFLDSADKQLMKAETLIKEFHESKEEAKLKEAIDNINLAYQNAKSFADIMNLIQYSPSTTSIRDMYYFRACRNHNLVANAYWKELGQATTAKELYREAIKKYKVDTSKEDLKVCVKDLEFALQDIDAEKQLAQQQQSKGEIDLLKKEIELLKKENEMLKKEIEELKNKLTSTKKKAKN